MGMMILIVVGVLFLVCLNLFWCNSVDLYMWCERFCEIFGECYYGCFNGCEYLFVIVFYFDFCLILVDVDDGGEVDV